MHTLLLVLQQQYQLQASSMHTMHIIHMDIIHTLLEQHRYYQSLEQQYGFNEKVQSCHVLRVHEGGTKIVALMAIPQLYQINNTNRVVPTSIIIFYDNLCISIVLLQLVYYFIKGSISYAYYSPESNFATPHILGDTRIQLCERQRNIKCTRKQPAGVHGFVLHEMGLVSWYHFYWSTTVIESQVLLASSTQYA